MILLIHFIQLMIETDLIFWVVEAGAASGQQGYKE